MQQYLLSTQQQRNVRNSCTIVNSTRTSVHAVNASSFNSQRQSRNKSLLPPPPSRSFADSKLCSPSRMITSLVPNAAQAEVGKLISKVEIPAFIPRSDLVDQLYRWAMIEIQEGGMGSVGCPCKVTLYSRDDTVCGFTISFLKDGVSATDVRVAFDQEITTKHEWVGRGADGFPVLEGNAEEVMGKHFEIRKIDDAPVNDAVRSSVRDFCQLLVGAINKYYAFGSCFVDDST